MRRKSIQNSRSLIRTTNIVRGEPKRAQHVDAKRDQFDIRAEGFLADDVRIELIMLAQPAALLFFVAKTLRDGKPLERLLEFAVMRSDHARQRRRQLGAHRHLAFAFVGKIEKLADNFRAAFFRVERSRFQDRPIPFHKAIAPRDFAPTFEDVIARWRNRLEENHGSLEAVAWNFITGRNAFSE